MNNSKWRETAMRIAEDVYAEHYNDDDIAINLIDFMVDKHNKATNHYIQLGRNVERIDT